MWPLPTMHTYDMRHWGPLLLTSDDQDGRPVQTCSLEDSPLQELTSSNKYGQCKQEVRILLECFLVLHISAKNLCLLISAWSFDKNICFNVMLFKEGNKYFYLSFEFLSKLVGAIFLVRLSPWPFPSNRKCKSFCVIMTLNSGQRPICFNSTKFRANAMLLFQNQ